MADKPYKFFLFAGADYYPSGGMNDYVGAFRNLLDAELAHTNNDWANVAMLTDRGLVCVAEYYDDRWHDPND